MATVWGDASGKILAAVKSFTLLQQLYPAGAPAGTITTLDFDETANPALVADLVDNIPLYTLTGGATPVLQKSGVTQAVVSVMAGASTAWVAALGQLAAITPLQIQQALTALMSGTATTAQEQKAVAFILLKLAQQGMLF